MIIRAALRGARRRRLHLIESPACWPARRPLTAHGRVSPPPTLLLRGCDAPAPPAARLPNSSILGGRRQTAGHGGDGRTSRSGRPTAGGRPPVRRRLTHGHLLARLRSPESPRPHGGARRWYLRQSDPLSGVGPCVHNRGAAAKGALSTFVAVASPPAVQRWRVTPKRPVGALAVTVPVRGGAGAGRTGANALLPRPFSPPSPRPRLHGSHFFQCMGCCSSSAST